MYSSRAPMDIAFHAGVRRVSKNTGMNRPRSLMSLFLSFGLRITRLSALRIARAHPRENFGRRLDRADAPVLRPVAELFAVLVRDPAGLVAALDGDAGEHGVPLPPRFRAIFVSLSSAGLDKSELALCGCNKLAGPFRLPAAIRTRLAAQSNRERLAGGAIE